MKTFKRIIALAIVLCTLGAMMIPGVTAATPASLTVDFATVFSNAGVASNTYLQAATGASLNAAYQTNKWTIYCGAGTTSIHGNDLYAGGRNRVGYLELRHNNAASYGAIVKRASQFIAPGTGDYVLSVSYGTPSTGDNKVVELGAYILPMPEVHYTKYQIPGPDNSGILTKATKTEPYSNGSVAGTGSGSGTFYAENTVSLVEGQEYMIIFYGVAGNTTNAYAQFTGFALNPVVKHDYTVTYHANYDGASPATVADNENTTTAATSAEFTVDNVPFVRDGYTLKGWATAPDGAVAYKAGDKITLTPDAASADLYAVWSDGNLSVNFASIGGNNLIHWDVPNETMIGISNNFKANGWKFYTVEGGAYNVGASYLRRNSNGYGNHMIATNATGGLHLQYHTDKTSDSYIPVEFEAPGTGEYKLSFTASRVHRISEGGAYIVKIPEGGFASIDDLPKQDSAQVLTLVNTQTAQSNNDTMLPYEDTNTIYLESGSRYAIVFFAVAAEGYKEGYLRFRDFSLTKVAPAASIAGKYEGSLAGAIAAATAGDTIKLMQDVVYEGVLNLDGVTLDLNGNKLTADAVIATVTDSGNGNGLIAAGEDSILTTVGTDLAIWDNTTGFEGYRVFTYSFNAVEVTDDQDVATGVNKFIDLYEAERVLVKNENPANLDENGEVVKGKGDKRFKDVTDDLAELYAAGTIDWRFEYSSQQYQMDRGGVCFSWGAKALRHFGNGFSAIRIQAPGAGKVAVKLATHTSELADADKAAAQDAGFDMYIVKASEIENACADYAANFAAFAAAPATAVTETATAFTNAINANKAVISGVSNGETYTSTFEFEEGVEYIVIFNNNGSVKGALHMNFQNISFTREAKDNDARTFWSYLEFNNTDAYKLVAASDLKVGFTMDWNGDWKDFEFDAATVNAWADKVLAEPETDWGFYIRVSGFESLTESGTLTGTPYIVVKNQRVEATNKVLSYTYEVPAAE